MSDQCDHILSPEDNCTAAPPRTPPSLPATACSPLQRPHCSHLIQGPGASWRPSSGDHWGDVIRSIHRVNPPVLITAFVICPLPGHWLLPNCARPGLTFNTATLAHSSPGPATAAALRQSAPELRGGHISAVRCPHSGYSYSYSYSYHHPPMVTPTPGSCRWVSPPQGPGQCVSVSWCSVAAELYKMSYPCYSWWSWCS